MADHSEQDAPGNEADDGGYKVGKGKPPEEGKFRKGDGRPRGRRPKGTKNLRTDFEEEMASIVPVAVNGKLRKVSRQRAILMRLTDNASRGQNQAIQMVVKMNEKFERGVAEGERREGSDHIDAEGHGLRLDLLTLEELEELDRLTHKANGLEYRVEKHPLAYLNDPNDERNYFTEATLDGLLYRRCTIPGTKSELIGVDNRAYRRTALPRRGTDHSSK